MATAVTVFRGVAPANSPAYTRAAGALRGQLTAADMDPTGREAPAGLPGPHHHARPC